MNKAVFLDKDGTIIPDVPYNVDVRKITLYPEVGAALRLLGNSGFKLIIISNQAGVAKGYFKEKDLEAVWQKINELLSDSGIQIDAWYYCPHHKDGKIDEYTMDCNCRKPKPGMILRAAKELGIDLNQSWMVGDIYKDIEAGQQAGCKTILINRNKDIVSAYDGFPIPDIVSLDLLPAALHILKH